MAVSASAQELKDGYISWGPGSSDFPSTLNTWTPGSQVTEDDNFFISRVKPRERFRNQKTQVNTSLTAANDKKLLAWLPVNSSSKNGLPDGVFDSEVFTMWPYVTHWGNWTAPVGRIPGAFLDVAHKNGVAVSGVASIPWGNINTQPNWMNFLNTLPNYTEKAAQFFKYYGIDGIGYNSEFTGGYSYMSKIRNFHANLVKEMRKVNPLFENLWYDGTNDNGRRTPEFFCHIRTHHQPRPARPLCRREHAGRPTWQRQLARTQELSHLHRTLGCSQHQHVLGEPRRIGQCA